MSVRHRRGGRAGEQAAGAASARRLLPGDGVSRPERIPLRPRSIAALFFLAALAALIAPAARAQTVTVTTDATGVNPVNLGLQDCIDNRSIVFKWNLNVTPTASDTVRIFITKDTASCCATSEHKATSPFTVFFCVRRTTPPSVLGGGGLSTGTLQVNFALVPPNAPSPPVATPGDSHLRMDWTSNDSGDQTYDVYVVPTLTPVDPARRARSKIAGTNTDVTNDSAGNALVNDRDYDLFVRSTDAFGNNSALSSPASHGRPIQIDEFYTHYRSSGGSAHGGGGCSTGAGAGLLAAAVLVAALFRR